MGNSAGKEQRPSPHSFRSTHNRSVSSPQIPGSPTRSNSSPADNAPHLVYGSRHGRGSRPDLSSFLGIGSSSERNADSLESRRETKQERETRKLEKERINREKERERSMREESVDGGYLVTQGVYTGMEDYNKAVVRQLMIERRIAPFWRGLNDHSSSWTENQLVAAARGLAVPAPDEIPSQESQRPFPMNDTNLRISDRNLSALTIPMSSRSPSFNSDSSSNLSPSQPTFSFSSPSAASSNILRGRAKTLATLTTSSKNMPQYELVPREMNLPKDPYVNGQPIEAYLYKDAAECPICFLYYPPYLNKTRCCDQSICSECFVQIKRPDPHLPEHADPTAPPPALLDSGGFGSDDALVSEPAACPFCVQPEFGVTYEQPPFRRGLTYVNQLSTHPLSHATSAMSSSSSLGSSLGAGAQLSAPTNRRRTTSISANSPAVITTDRVRPDWATKLSTARAHVARRSAAATALHTAAYLMGNRNGPDARNFPGLGRRTMLRRGTGSDSPSGIPNSAQLNMLALMSERFALANGRGDEESPTIVGPPRGSSRRTRVDDLEDMMLMEAIRLSLASEEERRKREEKEAKKEAKKKGKEEKKAEKAARKTGPYPSSQNQSSATLESPSSTTFSWDNGKGKGVQVENRGVSSESDLSSLMAKSGPSGAMPSEDAQTHLERSRAQLLTTDNPVPYGSSSYRPSHLRNLSNASSSASSLADSFRGHQNTGGSTSSFEAPQHPGGISIPHSGHHESFGSATPPGGGAGLEPMFNFRSLAAMIGNDENGEAPLIDHAGQTDSAGSVRSQPGEGSNTGVTRDSVSNPEQKGKRLEKETSASYLVGEVASGSAMGTKEREVHGMSNEETQRETGSV